MILSFVNLEQYLSTVTAINTWILATFSWLFSYSTFALLMSLFIVLVSPLGKVRIGGEHAKPLLTKWRWFSITLCTTIATGILFWSSAEPLYHMYSPPPSLAIESNSPQAQQFAMATMFMHWSFTPYAIYCVPALVFALCFYNLKKPFSISASLSLLVGDRIFGKPAQLIDGIALFALVAGMAASLGTGILILGGGIASFTGIDNSTLLMAGVALAIVATFVLSAVSGLKKGIARLSNINAQVFVSIFFFVMLFGPTREVITAGQEGLVAYLDSFVSRSLDTYVAKDDGWSQDWTVFYWANWYAWAPVTALFLGKISVGYTVRAFIAINLILPAIAGIVWMTAFSGTTLYVDQLLNGALYQQLQTAGPESVIYSVFDSLPFSELIAAVFIAVTFISFVTAADSNTDVISQLCQNDRETQTSASSTSLKYIWGASIGIIAWVMVSYASIEGVKMMSNLGGLPAMFIIIGANVGLLILVVIKLRGGTFKPHQSAYKDQSNSHSQT